jgi:hypothetical protein
MSKVPRQSRQRAVSEPDDADFAESEAVDEACASTTERELIARLRQRGGIGATCRAVDRFENSDNGYRRRYDSFALDGAA